MSATRVVVALMTAALVGAGVIAPSASAGADRRCPIFTDFSVPPKLRIVQFVPPKYPDDLLATKLKGHVRFLALVSADGSVLSASVIQATHPSFAKATLAAVRQWRFEPPNFGSGPTCVNQIVVVDFSPEN